ncbi:MAG: YigZ family protein [Bacilli bacterium]|nr:YigZ family protein [Bacilli bacterium]
MKSIKNEVINEIIINKSRFITVLVNVNSKDEVNAFLDKYKGVYKDATHYCFAYVIGGYSKCDDDGEPSGTAGMPILNVLQNNDLTNVLCIVIRYFGGIKLGAGGLVRAYSKSASECISNTEVVSLVSGFDMMIEFEYENIKQIDYILKDIDVVKKFDGSIIYCFKISEEDYLKVDNILNNKAKILKKEPILVSV